MSHTCRHHKAGGVSAGWVFLLCISSFCFGVFVVNRLWSLPRHVKLREEVSPLKSHQEAAARGPLVNCRKMDTTVRARDIFDHVSQTREVIMSLDKTISHLEVLLTAARAVQASNSDTFPAVSKVGLDQVRRPKVFMVMGIITAFSSRKRRDSVRQTWMPQGDKLKKLEEEKSIVLRFVIGHSASPGGVLDRAIDAEEEQYKDFLRLDHVEGYHELSLKTQIYFAKAVAQWDAEFYIKVDDDVHGVLSSILTWHKLKPRVHIGCMKSGPVLAQKGVKYHEPEHWKFGEEGNKYLRHVTGQLYTISKDLATYRSINRHCLHRYANEDVSLGSWFIGFDVEHID